MAYFTLNNHTFPLNIHAKNALFSFDFTSMHIIEATGFTEKIFEYIPGTDMVHVRIGGVDVSSTIDADLKALNVIPFKSSGVNITNLAIDFTVRSTSADQVHWELVETAKLTFDKVTITMENWFLQDLVKLSSGIINTVIKTVVVPLSEGYFNGIVRSLNTMVANEQPFDFEVPIGSDNATGLNLTMTTAPALVKDSDLLVINFDGLVDKMTGVSNRGIRGDIKNYAPRLQHSNSEQIWIHEDTFASVLKEASELLFPMEVSSTNLVKELHAAVPELKAYYGADVSVSSRVSMTAGAQKAVTFDMENGATLGKGATTTLEVICSNATTKNEIALTFVSNLVLTSKTYLTNFILFPSVADYSASGTQVTKNVVGLDTTKANDVFTSIVATTANDFNHQYEMGWPLANLNPNFGMIGGLLKNSTMSTSVTDEYMMFGFEMQADLPTATNPENPELLFL